MTNKSRADVLVFVGTYTQRKSEGIYVYRLDTSTGRLELASKATGVPNPSFLAIHPGGRYLYSTSEVREQQPGGSVSAFAVDPATGDLTFLNKQDAHGHSTCHVTIDDGGRYAFVANYGNGSLCVLPIGPDGRLGEATDVVQHEGSSVDPDRQEGPHAHSINLDPANQYAIAPDLGADKVMVYRVDYSRGKLLPAGQPWFQARPGAGPRHFAFHPTANYAYVINELGSTVTEFIYDQATGLLTDVQTIPTLPDDFSDLNHTADVHISASGKYLYGSNRGHDSIAVFGIDEASGRLTLIQLEPTQGRTPRNFAIDPTGALLLAANQESDTIVTFHIEAESGKLTPTGHSVDAPEPTCLKLMPVLSQ